MERIIRRLLTRERGRRSISWQDHVYFSPFSKLIGIGRRRINRQGRTRGHVDRSSSGSEFKSQSSPCYLPSAPSHSLPMAFTSLTKSPLPFLQLTTPKSSSSAPHLHPFLPNSSHSQIFGLRLKSSGVSSPAVLPRAPICAKVSKGDFPPNFNLKDQDGKNVSLSKYKGKPLVVYFYPADETPGCTKEACAFRDSYEKFKKAGAQVIGISGDDPASHKAFAKKYRLPFTLLSDEGNKVRKQWGVPSDLFGALPGRETYVIDKNGLVQLVYNNQFQPEKHVDETLKLLQSL